MKQTQLVELLMTEISGVSSPANLMPGFMVFKAAGSTGGSEMAWLARMLYLVTEGGVVCDPTYKAELVEKANTLLQRSEDGKPKPRRSPGGTFRKVEPRDLNEPGESLCDEYGCQHSGAVHSGLRALLSGSPRDAI